MSTTWTAQELDLIDHAEELEIAAERPDGSTGRAVPIWVVRVGDSVLVRTWYRRDTGWFGRAVTSGRARIRVPGLETAVTIADVDGRSGARGAVDAAYRAKYARFGAGTLDRMTGDDAAATTLRLVPARTPG